MFNKITRHHLKIFLEKYKTDATVLDVGSGGSSYHTLFPNRLTVDIDPGRQPDIVADAHQLPFPDGSFERVLCTEMLEHVLHPQVVADELLRVLKPGGLLILTTRFVFPLHDVPHDYWRFTKYGLRELFKAGEIVELAPETAAFSTIGVLLQRIAFQTRLRMNLLSKVGVLLLARVFNGMNFLIVQEFGDIAKRTSERDIMPSGYYLVVRKV